MHHFLVIFEDRIIRKDTMLYSLQLARRMEGSLSILMLHDQPEPSEQDNLQKEIAEMLEGFSSEEMVLLEVRHGDKASELLKYLALAPSFHTVVWGGDGSVLREARRGKKEHWFAKVAQSISCPIVTPMSKRASIGIL
jgi:hypothetical protein